MSRKALYRQHVAFVVIGAVWQDGESVPTMSNVVWTKGNLQPYKQGVIVVTTEAGDRYKDWRTLYVKDLPKLVGDGDEYAAEATTYFVYNNTWYKVISKQDWSNQARGVKHYEITAIKTPKPDGVTLPEPIGKITQNFEIAIEELKQATKLIGKE